MIEVKISLDDMFLMAKRGAKKPQLDAWVNKQLRDAGIPVKGLFDYQGVESGSMEIKTDFVANEMLFTWTPATECKDLTNL